MPRYGYTLMCEQSTPRQLVDDCSRAGAIGFDFAMISDHFHPWLESQGQSPFTWSVLGALAETTASHAVDDRRHLPDDALPPRRRDTGRGHHPADERRPLHARDRGRRAAQRARGRPRLAPGRRSPGDALRGHRDHPDAVAGRLPVIPRAAPQSAGCTSLHPPPTPSRTCRGRWGPRAVGLAGELGDGLIATEPRSDLVEGFRRSGGEGKRTYGQVAICWAADREAAVRTARELWRFAVPG